MNIKKITGFFILTVVFSIAVYDVWAFNQGGTKSTVSWFLYEWSYKYPAFPFAVGFIMGHLFWQMSPPSKDDDKIDEG